MERQTTDVDLRAFERFAAATPQAEAYVGPSKDEGGKG